MKRFLLTLMIMLSIVAVQAQTAEEVIQKSLEATGGSDNWKNVKSLIMEAVAVNGNGQEITTKITKLQGKILRREIDFGMGNMKMVVTPDKGWFASPRNAGNFDAMPQPMLAEQTAELDINPLSDYAAKGYKAELLGKEQADGKEVYKIKLTSSQGKERNYFIDANSFYVVKQSFMSTRERMRGGNAPGNADAAAGPTEVTVNFADFQKTPEGLVFPYTIATNGMGPKMNIEKIQVNPTVDEKSLMDGIKQ
jgi:uncharacterized membrane protein YkoI